MKPTKAYLLQIYGCRCMLCEKRVKLSEIEWHHIKPKYVSKANHLPPDDSLENGSLLCRKCHIEIHKYLWWDDEYQLLVEKILNYKEEQDKSLL